MSEERIVSSTKVTTGSAATFVSTVNPIKELNDSFKTVNTALLAELESNRKSIKLLEALSKQQMDRDNIKTQTITKLTETNEHLGDNLATVVAEKESIEKELDACTTELKDTQEYVHVLQKELKRKCCDLDTMDNQYSVLQHKLADAKTVISRHFTLNILLIITIITMVIAVQ